MPRFIGNGDTAILPLTLNNVQGRPGKYDVTLSAGAPVKIESIKGADELRGTADSRTFSVTLASRQHLSFDVMVTSPAQSLNERYAPIRIDLKGAEPSNVTEAISRVWTINLRPPLAPSTRLVSFKLPPGGSQKVDSVMLEDLRKAFYVPDTLQVVVHVGNGIGPAGALASSLARDLPPASLDALVAAGNVLLEDASVPANQGELQRIVNEMLALQTEDGSFLPYRQTTVAAPDADPDADEEDSGNSGTDPIHNAMAVELLGKMVKAGIRAADRGIGRA